MMYGEELHPSIPVTGVVAIALEAVVGAIFTKDCLLPGSVLYWGIKPSVSFDYNVQVTEGVLTLFRYTKAIQTAVLGNAPGAGYAVGDLLSVTQAGASGGQVRVTGVLAGAVTTVEVVEPGVNYRAAVNLATVAITGGGNNAFTATISDKKALDTLKLVDGYILGKQYMKRPSNAIADASPTPPPPCSFKGGEQLVVEITTAATGGGGIAGDFQPILVIQNRGENFAAQPLWVEAE